MSGLAALGSGSLVALIAAGVLYSALGPAGPGRLPLRVSLTLSGVLSSMAVVLCALWLGSAESIFFVLMVLMIILSAMPFLKLLGSQDE